MPATKTKPTNAQFSIADDKPNPLDILAATTVPPEVTQSFRRIATAIYNQYDTLRTTIVVHWDYTDAKGPLITTNIRGGIVNIAADISVVQEWGSRAPLARISYEGGHVCLELSRSKIISRLGELKLDNTSARLTNLEILAKKFEPCFGIQNLLYRGEDKDRFNLATFHNDAAICIDGYEIMMRFLVGDNQAQQLIAAEAELKAIEKRAEVLRKVIKNTNQEDE